MGHIQQKQLNDRFEDLTAEEVYFLGYNAM
jgi:hypothetical protein